MVSTTEIVDSGTEKTTSEIWNGVPGVGKCNIYQTNLICLCSESIYALYSKKICYMGKEKILFILGLVSMCFAPDIHVQ
jgi:hypothetical protein